MTVALVLLSLTGFVAISFHAQDYSVTKVMSAIRWERVKEILQIENSTTKETTTQNMHVNDWSSNSSGTTQNVSPLSNGNATNSHLVSKKFIFYVCDSKVDCYGLGDRQRGLVSVYHLAEVTNRTFGITMTAPSSFLEFYKPNLVPWDIPPEQLQGKSSVELVWGPKTKVGLHELDFNAKYPQDVVYIRTNHVLHPDLRKNPLYKDKFPAWAKVPSWQLFQVSWLRLMAPTETLRQQLNDILVGVAQKMLDEYKVSGILNNSKCCERQHTKTPLCVNSTCAWMEQREQCCDFNSSETSTIVKSCSSNETCAEQTNIVECSNILCNETNTDNCNNKTCSKTVINRPLANITNFIKHDCVRILEEATTNVSDQSRMKTFAVKCCNETRPVLAPTALVEGIRQKQGYDKVNINLVCVHIRLGHSATLPFEGVRNKPNTVKAVWEFLKPYLANGQHVYLATDSQEVRQQAKDLFGDRVHVSSVPIAHIDVIQKGQDGRSAFSLTLVEQLLLATSCKTLVISQSGYSLRAAQLRNSSPGETRELYMFDRGMVLPMRETSLWG